MPDNRGMSDAAANDARVQELIDNFSFLDDWEDRFRYLIDLGRKLPPMDEALKTEETKVRGCTSQVWIVGTTQPGDGSPASGGTTLHFVADSDAHIVKGLIAVLLEIYNGRTAEEILAVGARLQMLSVNSCRNCPWWFWSIIHWPSTPSFSVNSCQPS